MMIYFKSTTVFLLSLITLNTQCKLSVALSSSSSSSSSTSSPSSVTIRVCDGSSCLSKCRGGFNPKKAFMERISSIEPESVESLPKVNIEDAYCMNQCKRGPNMRIIKDEQVMTFDNGIMTDVEMKRKSFQSVNNEDRVERIWGLVQGMINDENVEGEKSDVVAIESGHVKKLTDMMPAAKI